MTRNRRDSIWSAGHPQNCMYECPNGELSSEAPLPLHAMLVRNGIKASGPSSHALKTPPKFVSGSRHGPAVAAIEPAGRGTGYCTPASCASDAANGRLTRAPQALISLSCCRSCFACSTFRICYRRRLATGVKLAVDEESGIIVIV